MQIISEKQHLRELLATYESRRGQRAFFATGISEIDERFPEHGLALGAVHEVLANPSHGMPMYFVALLAQAARKDGVVVWSDPKGELYPPALIAMGVPASKCLILRPRKPAEELWAIHECMGCRGVSVTVAMIPRMTTIEARRLQLAAERSGGVGLLMRPQSTATHYAAATRWLVNPVPATRTTQRWMIQLLHGQGGHSGETFILEKRRDSKHPLSTPANPVHSPATLVHHARKARVG